MLSIVPLKAVLSVPGKSSCIPLVHDADVLRSLSSHKLEKKNYDLFLCIHLVIVSENLSTFLMKSAPPN